MPGKKITDENQLVCAVVFDLAGKLVWTSASIKKLKEHWAQTEKDKKTLEEFLADGVSKGDFAILEDHQACLIWL